MSPYRLILVGLIVMSTGLCASAAEEADAEPTLADVLAELRQLREQVTALEARLAELEEVGQDESRDAAFFRELAKLDDHSVDGPPMELLDTIRLPEDPTREEVQMYVRKIMAATEKQLSFTQNDPQVDMLAAVGSEHVDVLLDQRTHQDYHLMPALELLLEEDHKPLVIERLERNPALAEVLVEKGWTEDARDVLIRVMNRRDDFYPVEFIDAVAKLQEPDTYEALLHYFVHGMNRSWTYKAIENLPDIEQDLEEVFDQAWRGARGEGGWSARGLATAAIERGHRDALDLLMQQLADTENHWEAQRARQELVDYVDFEGTDDALLEWYDRNKEALIFDERDKIFRLHGGI